ncbi:MAG TPA: hypothetical protein VGO62_09580, partial [Myxococcota bacterium]
MPSNDPARARALSAAAAATRTPPPAADPGLAPLSRRAAAAGVLALMPVSATVLCFLVGASGARVEDAQVRALFIVCSIGSLCGLFAALTASSSLKQAARDGEPARGRWLAIAAIPLSIAAT